MNVNPRFRYYVAFVLIFLLVLMMRVQVQPTHDHEQAGPGTSPATYYAAGASTNR